MFFREAKVFCNVIDNCIKDSFLDKVCKKYHYLPEDKEQMKQTALAMQGIIKEQALWQHNFSERAEGMMDGVVMTLGEGLDRLQESYEAAGKFSAEYMIEILSGEILLLAYEAYNCFMAENTPYHVARYYFPGSDRNYPLTMLPELLKELSVSVACNESYCMIPKKSVAFFALLTEEKNIQCRGICMDCGRSDCPNKAGDFAAGMKKADPLPYGYARIFGKEFL